MLKRLSFIAAGAAAVLIPVASEAATVTYTYFNVQTSATSASSNSSFTNATLGAGNTLTVAPGTFVRFSIVASVTGNANTGIGDYSDTAQPANLGLGAVGFNISDSNAASVALNISGGQARGSVNANFVSVNTNGIAAASQIAGLAGSNIANLINASNPAQTPRLSIGAETGGSTNANNLVVTNLTYQAVAGGSSTIAPTFGAQDTAVIIPFTAGTADNPPTYTNRTLVNGVGDTVTGPGNLVINVTGTPEPASLSVLGAAAIGVLARRRRA